MARMTGRRGKLRIGDNEILNARNIDWEVNAPPVELVAMGDDFAPTEVGVSRGSGSATAWWDPEDQDGQGAITDGAQLVLEVDPAGDDPGGVRFTLQITISNVSMAIPHDNGIERNFSFTLRSRPAETVIT